MKILVVNNHSKHLQELLSEFKQVEALDFQKIKGNEWKKYSAIILSGGCSLSVVDHEKEYGAELALIRNAAKPILGVCLGFELINFAFGEKLSRLENPEHGETTIQLLEEDRLFANLPKKFQAFEAHRWIVKKTQFLQPLAKSKDGIEAVRHPTKPIYGVQFHPEVLVKKSHAELIFKNFLELAQTSG